jgi:lipopolysaccharide export LptBFGC system permease protein LptF
MRLFDRYIGSQIFKMTVSAVLLLTGILVLGSVFQKIRPLLVEINAPTSVMWEFALAVMPRSMTITIPWAFLAAVLLIFGRLSSDSEITGFRSSGISLFRLALPVYVISIFFCVLCLWLNVSVVPDFNKRIDSIPLRVIFSNPKTFLKAASDGTGLAGSALKGVSVWAESFDEKKQGAGGNQPDSQDQDKGQSVKNLHMFKLDTPKSDDASRRTAKGTAPEKPQKNAIYVHAASAKTVIDSVKQQFRFHLYNASFETTDEHGEVHIVMAKEAVPVVIPFEQKDKFRPSSESIGEIRQEISSYRAEAQKKVTLANGDKGKLKGIQKRLDSDLKRSFSEIHRRYATSVACLAFAFIGVPLGIKSRRKDTSSGLVLSLLVGLGYFCSFMFAGSTEFSVILAMWAPNVICIVLGIFLLRRANFR